MIYAASLDLMFLVFSIETKKARFLFKKVHSTFISFISKNSPIENIFSYEKLKYFFIQKTKTETSFMYEAEMRAVGEDTYEDKKNKEGDFLRIGDDITIQVFYADGGKARIGVSAPRDMKIKKDKRKLYPVR